MAHIVKIASLTDELITVLTGYSTEENNPSNHSAHHESTLRILRSNNYARTNQFDVQRQLEGLEEKLRVYNKDNLADALRQRLDELARRSYKWTPEILHLFLELSDRPVFNLELSGIEFLEPSVEVMEPLYKWEDLAAEDPLLRDKHVWQNIDYGADSSDDENMSLEGDLKASSLTEDTAISSLENEILSRDANNLTVAVDPTGLVDLETSQFWRGDCKVDMISDAKEDNNRLIGVITESQTIREVLFMLSGLPTALFVIYQQDAKSSSTADNLAFLSVANPPSDIAKKVNVKDHITPAPRYALKQASSQVFSGMMAKFAQYGSSVLVLRAWLQSKQDVPLLQNFQYEMMKRIRRFDEMISDMQASLVQPSQDLIISLIEIHSKVSLMVRPLLQVSQIINMLNSEPYAHAFRFMELLYDRICASQMIGDEDLYEFLGTLFFDCFRVYLRPIRRWMEEGELSKNDHVFFISENAGELDLASLWLDRYKLHKSSNGTLHAPKFLHPATNKIFTTGKSVAVLKILGKYDKRSRSSLLEETALDFRVVCGSPPMSIAPFPELFDIAFDQWVKSKHYVTSSTLRRCLFDECGLRDSLFALENIYFMVNGAATSQFANALFDKLDNGRQNWNDRFTLTELAQGTIGSLPLVAAERLKATVSGMNRVGMQRSRKSVRALTTFALTYSLPWPVQIIIAKDSISAYQRIFSFLLQIRRSTSLLQGIRLVPMSRGINESKLFYDVRSRLLWFTSILYSYLTDLVIEPNTKQLRVSLREGEDVDQMINSHQAYMKKLTDQSLLGSKLGPIHKTIITILDLSIQLLDARTMEMSTRGENDGFVASKLERSFRQSLHADLQIRQQGLGRRRQADSSEEDGSESETKPSTILAADMELSYTDRMRAIRGQFDSLCRFVVTGLRGVARAGGEPNWDILAEKLESGLGDVV